MDPKPQLTPLPPLPGIVSSIKSGIDLIAAHLPAMLFPLVLDLLLWFGPRLSVRSLFQPMVEQMLTDSASLPAEQVEAIRQVIVEWLARYNLLTLLRTYPVGISSLMTAKLPALTPFGPPARLEVHTLTDLLSWMALLTAAGWILGGLYFHWVSQIVAGPGAKPFLGRTLWETVTLSLLFTLVVVMVGFPLLLVLAMIGLFSPAIMQAAVLVLLFFGAWLLIPLFFAPHGIYLHQQNALRSLYAAVRLARFTLPSSGLFVLAVFIIGQGLNYLWVVPPDDSWMLLVGIAGHAFITTALLAASFIYYREIHLWLERIFERPQAGPASL